MINDHIVLSAITLIPRRRSLPHPFPLRRSPQPKLDLLHLTLNPQRLEKLQAEHGLSMSRCTALEDDNALLESALSSLRAGMCVVLHSSFGLSCFACGTLHSCSHLGDYDRLLGVGFHAVLRG